MAPPIPVGILGKRKLVDGVIIESGRKFRPDKEEEIFENPVDN